MMIHKTNPLTQPVHLTLNDKLTAFAVFKVVTAVAITYFACYKESQDKYAFQSTAATISCSIAIAELFYCAMSAYKIGGYREKTSENALKRKVEENSVEKNIEFFDKFQCTEEIARKVAKIMNAFLIIGLGGSTLALCNAMTSLNQRHDVLASSSLMLMGYTLFGSIFGAHYSNGLLGDVDELRKLRLKFLETKDSAPASSEEQHALSPEEKAHFSGEFAALERKCTEIKGLIETL